MISQQQSREKRSIQRIHNLVVICTILYTKIEITGKYVYLSKLALFGKWQLLLKMKCVIGDYAEHQLHVYISLSFLFQIHVFEYHVLLCSLSTNSNFD